MLAITRPPCSSVSSVVKVFPDPRSSAQIRGEGFLIRVRSR